MNYAWKVPKMQQKKAKLRSKLYLEVKTQAISFKTQEKTQELGISLIPSCRKNGQKTSLASCRRSQEKRLKDFF